MADARAIIIGTGAGGLAAAAYLARDGFDVLALDQSAHLGGYLNPFERGGFQFDPGVHYVGECRPGQTLYEVLSGIGIDPTALFCELDPEGFDVYRFPGLEVRACRGLDAYRDRLADVFPHERQGLGRLFDVVRSFGAFLRALAAVQGGRFRAEHARGLLSAGTFFRWSGSTLAALLEETLRDPRARAVLAAAGGTYGQPPSRASAAAGIGVLLHYADGAFFPRGGSAALRDALVGAARKNGASFRTGARVSRIVLRGGRAAGVELEGGERLEADVIVSDADPMITFGELLPSDALPTRLLEKVRRTEPSLATFAVYLGMRRDVRDRGLGRFNVWDYPDWNIDALYAPVFEGRMPDEPLLFLSPNASKDDSGAMAPAGTSSLEVHTFAPYSMFERWRGTPLEDRGHEYQAEKERIAARILESLERRWPGVVGDVVVREISTPLTNEHYTLAPRGGAYGPAFTPAQAGLRRFRTVSPVRNLFLAGAGVFGDSVTLCLASGRVAARAAARALAARRRLAPWARAPRPEPA
ncbi:MAG: NAD(P)/FAD-dependent oxidoreductase [Sandaracinaceae bacterium]|nr:NAD(P)/FAD-dependent oxidoreductase [Sandaracinaceae bacterium]